MKKILLIEDDPNVCSFIYKGLTENGFEVAVALNGESGLSMFEKSSFDLIVLDIMLPDVSGLDVCKKIRETDQLTPVLFLTALGSAENIVLGLNTGADDYLVKPFKFIELVARINTLLRRVDNYSQQPNIESNEEDVYRFADLELDNNLKAVKRNAQEVSLTSTEYRLLYTFIKAPKKVFSRTELLEEVWGINFDIGTNVVDVYINYLRKKLEKNNMPRLIQTMIGMGYSLRESDENTN
ncbi:MAG: response regulator transcription factor [Bacteroidetes bacterium]|nr:MAG: response regulator transcription factor [Bacteroidota bacterium]